MSLSRQKHRGGFTLGDGDAEPQRVQPHQRRHGRARRQILADGGVPLSDGAIDRRHEPGVGELLPREVELRATLGEDALAVPHLFPRILIAPLGHLQRGDRGVEL